MARPVRVTVSGATGVSAPIPLNNYSTPFSVGIGCDISAGGSLTYTVEHTFDDVFAKTFNPSTATWFPNSGLTNKIADTDGNYTAPVTAVRLNVTVWTSGSVTMTVIQAGGGV
jgi:hypothetical protein